MAVEGSPRNPLVALRRFTRERPPEEQCDLCGSPLAAEHRHLLEVKNRQIACSCAACSILFSGQAEMKYRLIPDRIRHLAGFQMPDELWNAFGIPVKMAFFQKGPTGQVVALYPSPGGATESLLTFDDWQQLEDLNPHLLNLEPLVEALLVNRVGKDHEYYLAPIDECYKLVGLIRLEWRGLSGGTEIWRHILAFFAALKARSRELGPADA